MRFWIAILLSAFCVAPASAQNQLQSGGGLITSYSPAELVALLQQTELNARYVEENDGVHYLEVNEDGAIVYFGLRDCAGAGQEARCNIIQPFGFFAGNGVTLAQLNAFNLDQAMVSVAGLNSDGSGVIGSKIFLQGGVSQTHVMLSLGLYFLDLDTIISAIRPGTLADVSFDAAPDRNGSKISNSVRGVLYDGQQLSAADRVWQVNAVGANAPSFMNDVLRAYMD